MAPEQHSKPYTVFEAHCHQLINLAKNTLSPLSSTSRKAAESVPVINSNMDEIIARVTAVRTAEPSEAQAKVDSITGDVQKILTLVQTLHQDLDRINNLIKSNAFLRTWMIVMLVTFTEAYIEDALNILISSNLSSTSLPLRCSPGVTR
jgi:hypothetical protein